MTGALALVLGLTAAAPLSADDARLAAAHRSLSAAAGAAVARATPASLALAQDSAAANASAADDRGFFRTRKGKVAVVLFAAGMGWTIYSTKKDRDPVKSPIR